MLSEDPGLKLLSKYSNEHYCTQTFDYISYNALGKKSRAYIIKIQFSSVQLLSHADSLQPHEPQHARPPCPSPTPGNHPDPCPLSL